MRTMGGRGGFKSEVLPDSGRPVCSANAACKSSTVFIGLDVHKDVHMDVHRDSTNIAVADVPRAMVMCVRWAPPAVVCLR